MLNSALESFRIPEDPGYLYDPVRYTLEHGGKRIRPKLLLLTTGLCGGEPQKAIGAALAVEFLHNFTLIHDDIMDRANTRRGRPTIHKKWNDAAAILSGDVMFTLALKHLTGNEPPDAESSVTKIRLMQVFLDAIQDVCDGQALDMDFESRDNVRLEEYLKMIGGKTAALVRASMVMGAISADADENTIRRCGEIGDHTGLAFQIQDDLLDAVGDSSKFGKKVGGDIIEGKKTYLSILAFERADDVDREILTQSLGNRNADESAILQVIRIYHDLGVIDDAVKDVMYHYNNALENLEHFDDSGFRKEIKHLLDKLRVRDS